MFCAAAGGVAHSDDAIDVGPRKQRFLDEKFIESSQNVTLTMNPPYQTGEVLITADQPHEEGELLGDDMEPIEGFTREDATPVNGNSVRMPVRWGAARN